MCGICGIVNLQEDASPSMEVLERMKGALAHRGPDDEGIYLGKRIGLATRRLSIIDLISGHQPIHNEDKSIWIVFNGEIYNYKELRVTLENQGHHFYTHTDTEVIVHAYEQFGKGCVSKLRGMFAFALWDEKRHFLLLARDRLGIKPLYYAILEDKIIFASETQALYQSGLIKLELSPVSIDQFFSFSYVPGPQTIFQGIQKLSPAHILISQDGKIDLEEYWRLDYSTKLNISDGECSHRLLEQLEESISLHLVSDVPIGVFLSGGIDSSTITNLVSTRYSKSVKTFSLGFDDEKFNELKYARLVAEHFKTEHYEELITAKAIDSLPEIVSRLSEPLADLSIIPTYFIAKLAHTQVKVVLSGEGGDEIFAGYSWHKVSSLERFYQRFPLRTRQSLAEIIRNKDFEALRRNSSLYRRLRNFLLSNGLPFFGHYLWRISYFNPEQKQRLFSEDFKNSLKKIKREENNCFLGGENKLEDFLTAMLYFDTKLFLPNDLLAKMDQMTMAHSLEGRVPFLDHKLVEFVTSLPSTMKLREGKSKYILKKIISPCLPQEIIAKPKQGFMPPVKKWMRERFDDFFLPLLNDTKTQSRGYFNQLFIKEMINDYKSGQIDYSYQLWTIVAFELWLRMHLDKQGGF